MDFSAHQLAVIVPIYNELENIEQLMLELETYVFSAVPRSMAFLIDDGSTDGSAARLDELASASDHITIIHQKNAGHGAAILAGMEAAHHSYEWCFLIDGDCQIPLSYFPKFWELTAHYEAVLGIRHARTDPFLRKMISRILQLAVRACTGVRLTDPNAPYKLVSSNVVATLLDEFPTPLLIPSVYVAILAVLCGFPRVQVEVPYQQRERGTTIMNGGHLLSFSLRSFLEILRNRRRLQQLHLKYRS